MQDSNDRSRILDLINALDFPKDVVDFLNLEPSSLASFEPESNLDVDGDWDPLFDVTYLLILVAESVTEESIESETIDAQDQVTRMRRCSSYLS